MIFTPKHISVSHGSFTLPAIANARANACLDKEVLKEFWYNFSYHASSLSISVTDELIFSIGSTAAIPLSDSEYSINVDENGICLLAKSKADLVRGFMTLIDRIRAVDTKISEIGFCRIEDSAAIKSRMVHFCIFPETERWEIKRFIRVCAALKYTHLVLEFWGMLKYDCQKELAWSSAFTKKEIRPLIREANDLGLEIIPMFNHWGHASAGRVMHGKHVVLDQDPSLQSYFSEDGWCWDIMKPKVRALLASIRSELIELCGEGSYFHIGLDEAYEFDLSRENTAILCDYINETAADLRAKGRKAIIWGDMLLYRHPHYVDNKYTCNTPSAQIESLFLELLDKRIIIADWQYDVKKAPVETASVFKNAGFECLIAPWDRGTEPIHAAVSTVCAENMLGIMHTTWHTLSKGMPFVTLTAVCCFEGTYTYARRKASVQTAALLRRVMPIDGDYEKAGWSKFQISDLW